VLGAAGLLWGVLCGGLCVCSSRECGSGISLTLPVACNVCGECRRLALDFRAARPEGLLAYGEHSWQRDFLAMELVGGGLRVHLELGDGVIE